MVYWKCWVQIQIYIFEIPTPKSIFRQIWTQKFKVARFVWKLVHIVSHAFRFRIRTQIFEILTLKLIFGQILVKKVKVVCFSWKLACMVSWRCWFLFQHFWISKPKSSFGKIWTEKLKVVQLGWKLIHRVSRRCWFLFQHYLSQFPTLNLFLDKFGPKNSKLFILTENWRMVYQGCWFLFWQ